jgi:hypothetical protein
MTFTIVELLGIIAFVIALGVAYFSSRKPVASNGGEDLRKVMANLSNELVRASEKIRDLETSNGKLDSRIRSLESKLENAEKELVLTRIKLSEAVAKLSADEYVIPVKPMLLILGGSTEINERDRHALRRARVDYQRLTDATKKMIVAELRRRREEGNLYPWVHISARSDDKGIVLADGVADPDFWHENLIGVHVVFLASCSSSTTADELAGLADWVVYFQDGVLDQDASDFTYAFWLRVGQGMTPYKAYQSALETVPNVSEFIDIRRRPQIVK